ncbi:MAG: TSUP family transporter [Pseudonocardia sp.]
MSVVLAAGLVVLVGALVQGTVGFGMAIVAAPLLALLDPALVPVPLLVLGLAYAVLALIREPSDVDWRGVGWALLGRLPGIAVGATAVAVLQVRPFTALVALTVLGAAVLSMVRWRPQPTAKALVVAGVVSGVGGTTSAISGPPVALLYQGATGARVRATLAAYFVAGSVLSISGLALAGQVTGDGLRAGLLLLPFMLAGFLASGPARTVLDRGWTRPAVVGLAAAGALLLLARAAFGT